MKKAILMRRVPAAMGAPYASAMVPADPEAEAALSKIPMGETLAVKLDRSRSNPQNRLYWAIIDHVAPAVGYETPKALHKALKVALGYYDVVRLPSGTALVDTQSTAFDGMSHDEFQAYMDGAIRLICSDPNLLPGTNRDDLIDEVLAILGDPVSYDGLRFDGKGPHDPLGEALMSGVTIPEEDFHDPAHSAQESPQAPKAPIIAPGGDKLPLDPMEREIVRLLHERLEKQ
jgi:hypothetical protein